MHKSIHIFTVICSMHDLACIEILNYKLVSYHMKKYFVGTLGHSVWTPLREHGVLKHHFHSIH
jgi:hypothetical protein